MLEPGLFNNHAFYLFIKVAISISFSLYSLFAFVVLKQVHKMTDTLEVGFEAPIRFFALLHLLLSISLFLFGLVVL